MSNDNKVWDGKVQTVDNDGEVQTVYDHGKSMEAGEGSNDETLSQKIGRKFKTVKVGNWLSSPGSKKQKHNNIPLTTIANKNATVTPDINTVLSPVSKKQKHNTPLTTIANKNATVTPNINTVLSPTQKQNNSIDNNNTTDRLKIPTLSATQTKSHNSKLERKDTKKSSKDIIKEGIIKQKLCRGCLKPVGSVHQCDICKCNMHPWCGRKIGEEGFGQPIRCTYCDNLQNEEGNNTEYEKKLHQDDNVKKLNKKDKDTTTRQT